MKARSLLLTVLIVVFCCATAVAGEFGEFFEALNQPKVMGEVVGLNSIVVGHGVIFPEPGTKLFVLEAGGQRCGVWVAGPARFEYSIEDKFSLPLAERNLELGKGFSSRVTESEIRLSSKLREAVVWSYNSVGDPQPLAGAVEFSPWVREVYSESTLLTLPAVELMAIGKLDSRVAVAMLHGESEDFELFVDPVEVGQEVFYWLKKLKAAYGPFKGEVAPVQLLSQPSGRTWYQRATPIWTIDRLAVDVVNPEAERLEVSATLAVRALHDGLNVWRTFLPSYVIDNRENRNPIRVTKVTVDGADADFVHRDHELMVSVGRSVSLNERIMIEVSYAGDFAIRPNQKTHWRLGPGRLFPGQHIDLSGDFQITLDVPEPLVPFASGKEVFRKTENGRTILRTQSEFPGNFPTVVVGDYHINEVVEGERSCRVASHVFKQEKVAQRLGKLVLATQDYLEKLFATPYPYQELAVVEIDSWGWGQAPNGIIYITREAFSPTSVAMVTPGHVSMGVNERIVHEVAHGWWGGTIQALAENYWIIEGLAQYSAALAMRNFHGKDGAKEFSRAVSEWQSAAKRITKGATLHHIDGLSAWDPNARVDSWRLKYAKGSLVFHAMRQKLVRSVGKEKGDEQFVVVLRALLQHFRARPPHTQDLVEVVSQISGQDWQPWFDRYVYGTDTPSVDPET